MGAGLHIAPYSNGALKRLGIDLVNDKNIGAAENTGCSIWPPFAPKNIYISYAEEHKRWQHSRVMVHRAHLHTALRETALSGEGAGTPCTLRLSARVLSVDPERGEVLLAGGERVCGDLVLGADGVHSQCRKALEGGRGFVPFACGISAFRFTVPMQALRDDPVTAELLGPDGTLLAALTVGGIKRLICYPIAGHTLMNFVFLYAEGESQIRDKSPGIYPVPWPSSVVPSNSCKALMIQMLTLLARSQLEELGAASRQRLAASFPSRPGQGARRRHQPVAAAGPSCLAYLGEWQDGDSRVSENEA